MSLGNEDIELERTNKIDVPAHAVTKQTNIPRSSSSCPFFCLAYSGVFLGIFQLGIKPSGPVIIDTACKILCAEESVVSVLLERAFIAKLSVEKPV